MLSSKLIRTPPKNVATCKLQIPRKLVKVKALPIDLDFSSYIVGKGIILFTMSYCAMNWYFYRRTREDLEEKNKKD